MYSKADIKGKNEIKETTQLKGESEFNPMFEWVIVLSEEQTAENQQRVLTDIEAYLNNYYQSVSPGEGNSDGQISIRWALSVISVNNSLVYKFSGGDVNRGGVITPPPPPPPDFDGSINFSSLDEGIMVFSLGPPLGTGGVITPSNPRPPEDN